MNIVVVLFRIIWHGPIKIKQKFFATRNKNYKIGLILNIIICVDYVAKIFIAGISNICFNRSLCNIINTNNNV